MSRPPLNQWTKFDGVNTITTVYDQEKRAPKDTFMGNDFYRPFFLDREIAELEDGSWEMISMRIPAPSPFDDDLSKWKKQIMQVWEWIVRFRPTLAWVNDDDTFVAVSIREKGIPKNWAELRTLALKMGGNIMKRFGALTTSAYMYHEFMNVEQVDEPMYGPHPRYGFNPDQLVIMAVDDPPEEELHTVDGEIYMSPDMFEFLLKKMDSRIRAFDEVKADHQYKKHTGTRVFTIRGLGGKELWKGHVIVCDDLEAPLKAHRSNLKGELFNAIANSFALHMVPETQGKKVRSNRSTVGLFWNSLFSVATPGVEDSEGLLFDAFRKYINDMRDKFLAGRAMPFIDAMNRDVQDSITTVYSKIDAWVSAGLNLNISLYLQMLQAGAVRKMYGEIDPLKEPKVRTSLPAPYARQWKIKCWSTFRAAFPTSTVEEPAYGEYFTHPMMGAVVSNDTFRDGIDIWGKGDLDDGIEEHVRELAEDFNFLGMQFHGGEIVAVGIRNPIGITCDVDGRTGVEYFMLRPTKVQAKALRREYGELPILDATTLPLCIAELGDLHLDFPAPAPVKQKEYDFPYFQKQVEKAAFTQGIYGAHVNVRLNHFVYDLPFVAGGYEEDFIDTTAKTRDAAGLDYIAAKNAIERAAIDRMFEGMEDEEIEELVDSNPINVVIDFHRQLTNELMADMYQHIVNLQEDLELGHEGIEPVNMIEGVPAPIVWMQKTEKFYLDRKSRELGSRQSKLKSNKDYEAVGDLVAKQLVKYVNEEGSGYTRESIFRDLREAHRWILANMVEKSKYPNAYVERMFRHHDSLLMRGQLFSMLVAALEDEQLAELAESVVIE